ncbi:Cyclin-dependent kinase inhibitor 5 [Linum perenne]
MGRYMGKAKRTGHVAGMDLSLGVRTRAKTLALLRLQQQQQTTPKLHPPDAATASAGYLQLRSRRLEKSPVLLYGSNRRHSRHAAVVDQLAACGNPNLKDSNQNRDLAVEVSFGENCLDNEARVLDRSTRESTPCSLIRDPETIRAPGSTSRPTCSNNASTRMQNSVSRRIPTAREMDEFFAGAEDEQVKQFIDKYNFDPVNEKPLPPGRYEWEKLDP